MTRPARGTALSVFLLGVGLSCRAAGADGSPSPWAWPEILAAAIGALSLLHVAGWLMYARPLRRFLAKQGDSALLPAVSFLFWPRAWKALRDYVLRVGRRLQETEENLSVLLAASRALTSEPDVQEVYNRVLDLFSRRMEHNPCLLWLQDEDGFYRVKYSRQAPSGLPALLRLDPKDPVLQKCFADRAPLVEPDLARLSAAVARDLSRDLDVRCAVHLPLMAGDRASGVLTAFSHQRDFFDHDRLWVLSSLADYLSMAAESVRHYGELKEFTQKMRSEVVFSNQEMTQANLRLVKRVRELNALYDVTALMTTDCGADEFFSKLRGHLVELLDVHRADFLLWDERSRAFLPCPAAGPSADAPAALTPEAIPPLQDRLQKGEVISLSGPEETRVLFTGNPPQGPVLVAPLLQAGWLLGLAVACGKRGGGFHEEDRKTISSIALHASGYIWNLKLRQDKEQRIRDLTALQEVYSVLAGSPDPKDTFRRTVEKVVEALGADVCAFLLYEEATDELVTQPGAYGIPPGDEPMLYRIRVDDPLTSSGRVFLTGEPLLSADARNDPRVNPRFAVLWDYRSLIIAPLKVEGRSIGVLRVGHRQPGVFTPDHVRLAVLVAEHAAVIVQNARLYQRIQENIKELERLNHTKTEFLSMVSHELLTPLGSVKGFLNVLLNEEVGPLNVQQQDFLNLCAKSLERLSLLLDDLLDMSRIEAGVVKIRPVPVRLEELLEQARREHKTQAESKRIRLEVKTGDSIPEVLADPHRVRQVVDNLVSNALKFTPEKGGVTISAGVKDQEVVVSVSDTGMGVPEHEREKIFDRFYQVETTQSRRARGAGLGLAICKSLVELHGGRIWVESKPGEGSAFRFSLPRLSPSPAPEDRPPADPPRRRPSPRR